MEKVNRPGVFDLKSGVLLKVFLSRSEVRRTLRGMAMPRDSFERKKRQEDSCRCPIVVVSDILLLMTNAKEPHVSIQIFCLRVH